MREIRQRQQSGLHHLAVLLRQREPDLLLLPPSQALQEPPPQVVPNLDTAEHVLSGRMQRRSAAPRGWWQRWRAKSPILQLKQRLGKCKQRAGVAGMGKAGPDHGVPQRGRA